MQYKQSHPNPVKEHLKMIILLVVLLPFFAASQTTYLPPEARENILLERLEIMGHTDSVLNFSKTKPFTREHLGKVINRHLAEEQNQHIADYHITQALLKNIEYAPDSIYAHHLSKKPLLKRFYRTPANFFEVNTPDFFLAVNPVLQLTFGSESNSDRSLFQNSRGVTLRGHIANKIGFSAYVTENQERVPAYVNRFVQDRRAVPGIGFYQDFKGTGYDYFDARGYFTFTVAKYIQGQFGYDKNFIGNGQRSLFLSDFSAPYLFLKLNTRIWKLNYQNLFIELNSAHRLNADQYFPKKYAAMHHLDVAVTKWLNMGVFEAVVFGRENHFEFGYLNPLIFYRSVEQQSGSFDNAVAGIDFKAHAAKKFQIYGQLLVDEFSLKEMRRGDHWWGNKVAYQLGAKYLNAFGISHLDLQLENNRVRPFTYSHGDSVSNYTHYNQPLAHPLGANLYEWIGVVRFQPTRKLLLQSKLLYYVQGKDTGTVSFGGNIFLPNVPPYRTRDYDYTLTGGIRSKTTFASMLISYELKPNLYLETNAVLRKESATSIQQERHTFFINAGVRWNMQRRDFEF